jgi:hypothetical protein
MLRPYGITAAASAANQESQTGGIKAFQSTASKKNWCEKSLDRAAAAAASKALPLTALAMVWLLLLFLVVLLLKRAVNHRSGIPTTAAAAAAAAVDAVLDACLAQDPSSKVACETAVKDNFMLVFGEITSRAELDYAGE